MKKYLIALLLVLLIAVPCYAVLISATNTLGDKKMNPYWFTRKPKDDFMLWVDEMEDWLDGTTGVYQLYLVPTDTAPTATEGRLYYNDSGNTLELYTGSAWVSLSTGAGGTLDTAYNASTATATINVDAGSLILLSSDSANITPLHVDQDDTGANSALALRITNAGTGNSIDIEGQAASDNYDIQGTGDTWTVSTVGGLKVTSGSFTGTVEIELANGQTIIGDTDTEIQFADNSEDIAMDFTTDTMTWVTDSGVATMGFGDVDRFTGVNLIHFDQGSSTIQLAANGSGDDLNIKVSGGQDASLNLTSDGTATDAVNVEALAGGMTIDATDDLAITLTTSTGGEDLTITNTGSFNSSIILSSGGTGADALSLATTHADGDIKILSTDQIDIDSVDAILVDVSAGYVHINCASTSVGSITLESSGNGGSAILLHTNGGTNETIKVHNDQGTTAASIDIDTDVGGITAHADAGAVVIQALGSSAGDMTLFAGDNFDIKVTGSATIQGSSSLVVTTNGDGPEVIYLHANGGVRETVKVHADQGTSWSSIDVDSDVGGINVHADAGVITLLAAGASAGDMLLMAKDNFEVKTVGSVTIQGSSSLVFTSGGDGPEAIYLHTSGGTRERIKIHNDTGTHIHGLELDSDVGGIYLHSDAGPVRIDATGSTAGDMKVVVGDDMSVTVTGNFDLVTTGSCTLDDIYYKRYIKVHATRSASVTAAETGAVFYGTFAGTNLLELPTAVVGLTYTFIDIDSTAGRDVFIRPGAGDSIGSHTVGGDGKCIASLQDTAGPSVTLVAITTGSWMITGGTGTWTPVGYN